VGGSDPAAPTMGVATAFWGGLSAGIFGSSDLNIVGPAGALSGMLHSYTISFNGAGVLPYLSLLSAVWVFLVWALSLQRYLLLMPKAVFEGFTTAVAIIIGLNQLNMAFGLHPPGPKHTHFYENVIESFMVMDQAQAASTIFFIVTCALLLGLVKYLPKIRGVSIPWTVIIPIVTMVFGYLSDSDHFGGIVIPTLKNKYGVLKARVVELPQESLSHYAQGNMFGVLIASFGVAFVAVLETLISAKIAEQKMDWGFDDGRETLGLVAAHTVCGVVGAMPPTGVFVRTSLNMQLGATHKLSQILNAIFVFLISVVAMPVFSYLPQASVAALLVFASVRMAPAAYVRELFATDAISCGLLIVTTLICVFMDPVYGLIIGMVIALLRDAAETAAADARLTVVGEKALKVEEEMEVPQQDIAEWDRDVSGQTLASLRSMRSIRYDKDKGLSGRSSPLGFIFRLFKRLGGGKGGAPFDSEETSSVSGVAVLYEPIGPVVYLAADKHIARMKTLVKEKPARVVLSLELATRVDVDGSEALAKGVRQMQNAGIDVEVVLPPLLEEGVLGRASWVTALRNKGHVHEHRKQAIKCAGEDFDDDDDSCIDEAPHQATV